MSSSLSSAKATASEHHGDKAQLKNSEGVSDHSKHRRRWVCSTREETMQVLKDLRDGPSKGSTSLYDVYGQGPIVVSNFPTPSANQKGGRWVVGIDEAGRGPVVGPMVYAAALWWIAPQSSKSLALEGFPSALTDSKALTPEQRQSIFSQTLATDPRVGFVLRLLPAAEISRNMLRAPPPYNLNQQSHNAAMEIIDEITQRLQTAVHTVYVDTVGSPDVYRRRLQQAFSTDQVTNFVVEKKADATYAPCSAASIVAKVMRDDMLHSWKEAHSANCGSGYPSDPHCKSWLASFDEEEDHHDEKQHKGTAVFSFPPEVRFSWAPIRQELENNTGRFVQVAWEADEEDDGNDNADDHDDDNDASGASRRRPRQSSLASFVIAKEDASFQQTPAKRRRRRRLESALALRLGLTPITQIHTLE